ncbi:PadR family transcriptional regulator [Cupriavidus sp. 30B13]|uniref:PadR family transcriptional regulator n=1 Tax=Cupriavidus sp. 30B13 TaxID=3384241 RepID=UPI003B91FCE7
MRHHLLSHHLLMGRMGHHMLARLSSHFASHPHDFHGRGEGRHAIGRHRHGGGPGGFFGGGGDGFDGEGDAWRRGRKFSADDLQLLLLSLLEEKPSHGYELIKELETRTNGFYKPSPGMVYPALTFLEEVGYATVDSQGNKKRYQLAGPGRAHLDANRERLALMLNKLKHVARKMEWVRRALSGDSPEAGSDDGAEARGGWLPEFVQARMALKRALLLRTDAAPDEQRRIAAILARATAEIEAGPGAAGA